MVLGFSLHIHMPSCFTHLKGLSIIHKFCQAACWAICKKLPTLSSSLAPKLWPHPDPACVVRCIIMFIVVIVICYMIQTYCRLIDYSIILLSLYIYRMCPQSFKTHIMPHARLHELIVGPSPPEVQKRSKIMRCERSVKLLGLNTMMLPKSEDACRYRGILILWLPWLLLAELEHRSTCRNACCMQRQTSQQNDVPIGTDSALVSISWDR